MHCTTIAVTQMCGKHAAKLAKEIITISGQDPRKHASKNVFNENYCNILWEDTSSKMNISYSFENYQNTVYSMLKSLPATSSSLSRLYHHHHHHHLSSYLSSNQSPFLLFAWLIGILWFMFYNNLSRDYQLISSGMKFSSNCDGKLR